MSKMIQIRNVPEDVHRRLKAKAAEAGMTLSDYLLGEVESLSRLPTRNELRARLERQPPLKSERSIVDLIRGDRERG